MKKKSIKIKREAKTLPARQAGFSLIEVLVTVAILLMGIGGILVLMVSSLKSSENSKNQIIASQLAQEGTELMRNYKDNSQTFNSTSKCNNKLPAGYTYRIGKNTAADCSDPNFSFATDGTAFPFYIDDGSLGCDSSVAGFYTYKTSCPGTRTKTKFFREISVEYDTAKQQTTVTSYVTWNGTGFTNSFNTPIQDGWCSLGNKCVSVSSVIPD